MTNRTTAAWQRVRLPRAQPPAGVTSDRAGVFASALEQSEQLMRAASEVGPAARPLPLFYALSQAGRAIGAARLSGGNWRLAGHGLSVPPQDGVTDLLRRTVRPAAEPKGRRSSLAGVAEAMGSDKLTGSIELGAVWAAMPDPIAPLPQMPGLDPAWRRPLHAFSQHWDGDEQARNMAMMAGRLLELLLGGIPVEPDPSAPLNMDELVSELETHYPTSSGVAVPGWQDRLGVPLRHWAPTGESLPTLCWPEVYEPGTAQQLEAIAANYRSTGVRLLIPRIAGRDRLDPLMLWWVLLFGLSSVARYDPELRVGALDVNNSPQAVPLEAALEEGLNALPELILDALTTRPA